MSDIHPKQLENVKADILAVLENGPEVTKGNFTERLEAVAEAATRAAFRVLPIEDAPKDGTKVLAFQKGNENARNFNARIDTFRTDTFVANRGVWWRELPEAPYAGFIPIPTQESE
ncbi:hypothetical protein [Sneathiella glossodoripedis]|uniref:hypothetical protein n=1 Tax=Sneathiella glossodoripedis TaxID=418853 RepID=UPI000471DBE2|nr:hypothetical protein [Sneathiella glossodoripedis]